MKANVKCWVVCYLRAKNSNVEYSCLNLLNLFWQKDLLVKRKDNEKKSSERKRKRTVRKIGK